MESTQSSISFSLLIVEDDKSALDLISRMVAKKFPKCSIYTAANGIQGKELFKQCTPDVVVTDIIMPLMEGFEMIREISTINTSASFIVLTAYSDKITLDRFKDLGVCAFLLKPLDFSELFAAIVECCGKAAHEEE